MQIIQTFQFTSNKWLQFRTKPKNLVRSLNPTTAAVIG